MATLDIATKDDIDGLRAEVAALRAEIQKLRNGDMPVFAAVLSPAQAAKFLGIHRNTVLNYIQDGALDAKRIGGQYRIERRVLEDFLKRAGTKKPRKSDRVIAART
jgi:excisionase family DNA binding protein